MKNRVPWHFGSCEAEAAPRGLRCTHRGPIEFGSPRNERCTGGSARQESQSERAKHRN